MFIGEAPGRLGADGSTIPFHGDQAGDNFESLLGQVGLSRYRCFVTNAVLCNPRDEKGNNATPSRAEIANCARFLRSQLDLINPKIVVTLGAQALQALNHIENHGISLSGGVRRKWDWYGRTLIPLYHPGQRAMIHRSFVNQLAEYGFVAEAYRRLDSRPKALQASGTATPISSIVRQLLLASGSLSYFGLHKLFYLLEYEHCRRTRQRMTSCYILRQKDGPYVVDLHIRKLKKAIPDLQVSSRGTKLLVSLKESSELFSEMLEDHQLDDCVRDVMKHVVSRYAHRSDDELKRIVYLTSPMRQILRREKYHRENLFNAPVDFSVVCAPELCEPTDAV